MKKLFLFVLVLVSAFSLEAHRGGPGGRGHYRHGYSHWRRGPFVNYGFRRPWLARRRVLVEDPLYYDYGPGFSVGINL